MAKTYKLVGKLPELSKEDKKTLEDSLNAVNSILDRLEMNSAKIGMSLDDVKLSALRKRQK